MKTKYIVLLLVLFAVVPAFCQFEAGATVYGAFSGQPSIVDPARACPFPSCSFGPSHVNTGFGLEGFVADYIGNLQIARFSVELPVLFIPNRGTDVSGATFSTVAITPGLRVNIAPKARISPFLTVGGGIAHFTGNTPSATNVAFAAGGGVEFKTGVPLVTLRVQLKDLVTSYPLLLPAAGQLMNDVQVGGGMVFRF